MNYYESVFILHPDMGPQEVEETVNRMEEVVATSGGQVAHKERWGKRKLAYKVRKQRVGYYVLMQIATEPEGLRELERVYRLSEQVLKYQNVRIRKEDVGKVTLDREVMQEAMVEAPKPPAREKPEEAAAPAASQPEPVAGAARESAPEVAAREDVEEGASPEGERPPDDVAAEADESAGLSSPEEET